MKVGRIEKFADWLARRRLGPALAAHSLRFGGAVAGRIDECDGGLVRGWIYDARRRDVILRLEILVDGRKAGETTADIHRDDLAQFVGGAGRHGFRFALPAIDGATLRKVSVRLVDRPRCAMHAIALGADTRSVDARLQHIFDHVTATHERVMDRLDRLAADGAFHARTGAAPHEAVLLTQAPRSAMAGVGRFRREDLPDAVEEQIMAARLRQAALEARSRA